MGAFSKVQDRDSGTYSENWRQRVYDHEALGGNKCLVGKDDSQGQHDDTLDIVLHGSVHSPDI